jgi:hypothetical protein
VLLAPICLIGYCTKACCHDTHSQPMWPRFTSSTSTSRLAFAQSFDIHPLRDLPSPFLNTYLEKKCGSGVSASHQERFIRPSPATDSVHGRSAGFITSAKSASTQELLLLKLAIGVNAQTALLAEELEHLEFRDNGTSLTTLLDRRRIQTSTTLSFN